MTVEQYFKGEKCPQDHINNATALLNVVSRVEEECGIPFVITSGYRSPAKNVSVGGAPASNHMTGHAVDIHDPRRRIAHWCLEHQDILSKHGLYCEDFRATIDWVHFQDVPPKSRKRFFIPSAEWAKKLKGPLTLESLE